MKTSSKSDPTQLLFGSNIREGRWIIYTPHCQFWHDSFCQASWYTIFGNVAVFCITELIHHCCQCTCSLENAFRNFQQRSFERKHGIVLKSYSPEYSQKTKCKKKKWITFPLKCVLLLQMFIKFVVHLKDFLFCFSPLSAAMLYIYIYVYFICIYCCFCCHAGTSKHLFFSLLCWKEGSYFISFWTIVLVTCKKKILFVWNFISNGKYTGFFPDIRNISWNSGIFF